MATIRASCSGGEEGYSCGDVSMTEKDVTILKYAHDDSFQYRFRCPLCKVVQLKSAESRTADMLIAVNCELKIIELAYDGLAEHLRGRPPVSVNDLIDAHKGFASVSTPEDLMRMWASPTTDL